MMQSSLPDYLWAEAVNTANYILNRCPTSCHGGKTPFEKWKGQIPDVSNFQEFGREVMSLKREPQKDKFETRSRKGIFIGYSEISKGYRLWLPEERKIEIARDVKFMNGKSDFIEIKAHRNPSSSETVNSENEELEIQFDAPVDNKDTIEVPNADDDDPDDSNDDGEDEDLEDRSGYSRGRGRPRLIRTGLRGRPRKQYQESNQAESLEETAFIAEIPIQEAIQGPDAEEWRDAIAHELKSLLSHDTWQIVSRPENKKIIGSRIVLRNKYKQNGTLERRKARIVAKEFAQRV